MKNKGKQIQDKYKRLAAILTDAGTHRDLQPDKVIFHGPPFEVKAEQVQFSLTLEISPPLKPSPERLPHTGEYIICLLLPKKSREELLGDLAEEYQQVLAKFGQRPAELWFYKQVLTSLWPLLQTVGRTLTRWGLIGLLEELIRRIAH